MVAIAGEVCGSVRVRGKNPKSVWWNHEVKATAKLKGSRQLGRKCWELEMKM